MIVGERMVAHRPGLNYHIVGTLICHNNVRFCRSKKKTVRSNFGQLCPPPPAAVAPHILDGDDENFNHQTSTQLDAHVPISRLRYPPRSWLGFIFLPYAIPTLGVSGSIKGHAEADVSRGEWR